MSSNNILSGSRCREAQAELVERIRFAVALPVRISIKDVYDDTCTELLVTAQLDSGAAQPAARHKLETAAFAVNCRTSRASGASFAAALAGRPFCLTDAIPSLLCGKGSFIF